MKKIEFAPFYVWQKITRITAKGHWFDVKSNKEIDGPKFGEIVTVMGCYLCEGGWLAHLKEYPVCNNSQDDGWMCVNFKPVQEIKFPQLSLSQIKEKEKEEILISN